MQFERWRGRAVVRASIPLLLAGCATTGGYSAERGRQLEERVDRIEADGASPRADPDRAAAQERAQRVDARIQALEAKAEQAAASRQERPAAGDAQAVAALREELARVRKQLDEHGRKLDGVERTIARLESDSARRVASPAPPATRSPPRQARSVAESPRTTPAPAAPAPGPAPAAAAPRAGGGPAEVLALARQQEANGQREVARDLYEEYVRQYPSDPGAAEARFRLGELAYAEHRYQDAIREYGRVAQDFSRSDRAPDALLRTAESMLAAGMKDEAAVVLADVPRRYPNTPAAARARQRLSALGGGGASGKP